MVNDWSDVKEKSAFLRWRGEEEGEEGRKILIHSGMVVNRLPGGGAVKS
jgi:hypothetical protein